MQNEDKKNHFIIKRFKTQGENKTNENQVNRQDVTPYNDIQKFSAILGNNDTQTEASIIKKVTLRPKANGNKEIIAGVGVKRQVQSEVKAPIVATNQQGTMLIADMKNKLNLYNPTQTKASIIKKVTLRPKVDKLRPKVDKFTFRKQILQSKIQSIIKDNNYIDQTEAKEVFKSEEQKVAVKKTSLIDTPFPNVAKVWPKKSAIPDAFNTAAFGKIDKVDKKNEQNLNFIDAAKLKVANHNVDGNKEILLNTGVFGTSIKQSSRATRQEVFSATNSRIKVGSIVSKKAELQPDALRHTQSLLKNSQHDALTSNNVDNNVSFKSLVGKFNADAFPLVVKKSPEGNFSFRDSQPKPALKNYHDITPKVRGRYVIKSNLTSLKSSSSNNFGNQQMSKAQLQDLYRIYTKKKMNTSQMDANPMDANPMDTGIKRDETAQGNPLNRRQYLDPKTQVAIIALLNNQPKQKVTTRKVGWRR